MSSSQRVRNYRERQRALKRSERWIDEGEWQIVQLLRANETVGKIEAAHWAELDRIYEEQLEIIYENAQKA